jgi:alkylation response protein AidB-like acyl-CoA dehydrogenase
MPPFNQPPPQLGNQFSDDRPLRSLLARHFTGQARTEVEEELADLGALAGGELYRLQLDDRLREPTLTHYSAWGERIDRIELTAVWQRAERLAAERGLVATAYEQRHGALSRVHQFALAHLFTPATDIYSCPLAMTDGAARTLVSSGNRPLIERAVPHLTSRDPARFWTSGQWMTESTGGSDVGRSESTARLVDGQWRLYGRKWFTSAATSQMALTLARPEGNGPGGGGLALFYVETRDPDGRLRNLILHRLKDKLGTRKLPTAELTLDGTPAELVGAPSGGVRAITPMLNVTRTWNAVSAVALMRRSVALSRDYARRRIAFGAALADKPLHADTLAWMAAEAEAGFFLTFFNVALLGREETGEASDDERQLLRLLTPIVKLTTGKQVVAVASEALESFGGAGYVEDTGLPVLLRDAQVLPIWEGTTNVLALDTLRALAREGDLGLLRARLGRELEGVRDGALGGAGRLALAAIDHATRWLEEALGAGPATLEAGARRFALTLGRATALALLVGQAQWSLDSERDGRCRLAALHFARAPIDLLSTDGPGLDVASSSALAADRPLPLDEGLAHGATENPGGLV